MAIIIRVALVFALLPTALRVQEERFIRIPTAELNRILQEAVARNAPPSKAGKPLKF